MTTKKELDRIAEKHGLATIGQVKQLANSIDKLIETLRIRNICNKKELQRDIVRYRLSKGVSKLLKDIQKGES